jgi:ribosomal protein S18 acetylase RimI-like enzyme
VRGILFILGPSPNCSERTTGLHLIALEDDRVIGCFMAGYDRHRGWLYSVGVRYDVRRNGVGTALVRQAEQALRALGCRKFNLQVRGANEAIVIFYEGLG